MARIGASDLDVTLVCVEEGRGGGGVGAGLVARAIMMAAFVAEQGCCRRLPRRRTATGKARIKWHR